LNDREIALASTYFRMYGWMLSLVSMNENIHFQGIASATRSLFELMLDMELIQSDKDGRLVQQYHTFVRVEKYRVANRIVAFSNQSESQAGDYLESLQKFIEKVDSGDIASDLQNNWGLSKEKVMKGNLKHWTGLGVIQRARQVDQIYGDVKNESLYHEVYSLLSWYIHSGSTGTLGLTDKAIDSIFRLCHYLVHQMFINATEICAKEFKIDLAIHDFNNLLDEASLVGAKYIQEQGKSIISST